MRFRLDIVVLILLGLASGVVSPVRADSEESKEYQVKAAFIYNFIKFVDWPKEKEEAEGPIVIGIIGFEDFVKAFNPVKENKVKERNISIKYFAGYETLKRQRDADDSQWDKKMDALKVCHVLMFCHSDPERIQNPDPIVDALKDHPILTVGETSGFIESGGIINFVKEEKKVRFEINNTAARKARLDIRSKLLRLAKKVIDDKTSNGDKN